MLTRIPRVLDRAIAFELSDQGQTAEMTIGWTTLERQFGCTIENGSDAAAVFDGNSATINRGAEIARERGCYRVEVQHFKNLPESYPID